MKKSTPSLSKKIPELAALTQIFDGIVLQPMKDGFYKLLSKSPAWFGRFVSSSHPTRHIVLIDIFPEIATFIAGANRLWQADPLGYLRSEPWEASDLDGRRHALEATVFSLKGIPLLLINLDRHDLINKNNNLNQDPDLKPRAAATNESEVHIFRMKSASPNRKPAAPGYFNNWQGLAEQLPYGLGMIRKGGLRIEYANTRLGRMLMPFVKPGESLVGNPFSQFLDSANEVRFRSWIQLGDAEDPIEIKIQSSGSERPLLGLCKLLDLTSNLETILVCVWDTTPQQKEIQTAREQNQLLEAHMRERIRELEESHHAIRALARNIDERKRQTLETVSETIQVRIMPIIKKLRSLSTSKESTLNLDLIELYLKPLIQGIERPELIFNRLTETETRVALMIHQNMNTDAIAEAMHVSPHTVKAHRKRIRQKLEMASENISLKKYLNNLIDMSPS